MMDKKKAMPSLTDPLVLEEARLGSNLREGLGALLNMHTPAELGSLCGALGLLAESEFGTPAEKKAGVLRSVGTNVQAYVKVLAIVWDGILFEYLRAAGQRVAKNVDPRRYVLAMWRERTTSSGTTEFSGSVLFRPSYVPRIAKLRTDQPAAADLEVLLRQAESKELTVKHLEAKVRSESDYRHVVALLAATASLHEFERDARDYLMHELESSRARQQHYKTSLDLSATHLEELERSTEALTSAPLEFSGGSQTDFFFERNAVEQAAEKMQLTDLLQTFLHEAGPADGTMEGGASMDKSIDGPASDGGLTTFKRGAGVSDRVARRLPTSAEALLNPTLLCAMALKRHSTDVDSVTRRAEAGDAVAKASFRALGDSEAAAAAEAARGDCIDRRLRRLEALTAELVSAAAEQAARGEAELELCHAIAVAALAETTDYKRRLRSAAAVLEAMMTTSADAVAVAGALGASREAALEFAERSAMAREEEAAVLAAAIDAGSKFRTNHRIVTTVANNPGKKKISKKKTSFFAF